MIGQRLCLKMALPYPASARLLSSLKWRLRSSCHCSNTWLIYHPWPERGATERGPIASFPLFIVQLKPLKYICKWSEFAWFKAALLTHLVSESYCICRNSTSMWGQNDWWVFFFLFLSPFYWKMWWESLRLFILYHTHFPQIIPFTVGWLRTLHWRFPYLTLGAAGEWLDVFLAGQQCGE